jgi:hypothetical protein
MTAPTITKFTQFNGIMWISPTQNFTQTGEEICKVRVEIHFSREVKLTITEPIFTKLKPAQQFL